MNTIDNVRWPQVHPDDTVTAPRLLRLLPAAFTLLLGVVAALACLL